MNPNFCVIGSTFNIATPCFPRCGQFLCVAISQGIPLSHDSSNQEKLEGITIKILY